MDIDKIGLPEADRQELQKAQVRVLSSDDPEYPESLKNIPSPPPFLYVRGHLSFDGLWLAVVGSRHPTDYGSQICKKIVSELVEAGIGIVSGFAIGLDLIAQRTAVACGGRTIGVLGTGILEIYPKSHQRYVPEILGSGALISEFSPRMTAFPYNFPRRNRIISGLARGVLVVEAQERSGSLSTAGHAADQGRDVFAIPGSVLSEKSKGCHRLISQGAKLVTSAKDILEEWKVSIKNQLVPLTEEDKIVALCGLARSTDELVESTGMKVSQLSLWMTKLELEGKIASLPGGRFQAR